MSKIKNEKSSDKKNQKIVITVRIDQELNEVLDEVSERMNLTKAMLIRNYLDMCQYVLFHPKAIRSLDDRDLVFLKREDFHNILKENLEEVEQMGWGMMLARFINDIARYKGKIDDIAYKLNLCEKLGYFKNHIDEAGYIWFSKRFGPAKFVEAFAYKLINYQPEFEYNLEFTSEKIADSKTLRNTYNKIIKPVDRNYSYYSYEFAKIEKE